MHGLGSNGALMWRFGVALAGAGWHAEAIDLRGHGTAPRALDYTIAAYAADVSATVPGSGGAWDVVVGHSLGGAAAVVAAAEHPGWARRLILVDPAIRPAPRDLQIVRQSQEAAFADPTTEAVRAEHPAWHEQDIELKALSAQQASRWAVEQTSAQNEQWDVRSAAAQLGVPTHVIASDPAVYSIFKGALVEQVRTNPLVTVSVVTGAGHSPHRDRPDDTVRHLLEALR